MNERKQGGEGDEESEGLKASIFAVVLLALRDSELSFGRYALLLVLEFLQVLQFAFSRNMQTPWKQDDVFPYISSFLSFTHISHWLNQVSLSTYIVIFYICAVAAVLPFSLAVYVGYAQAKQNRQMQQWPVVALRLACHLVPSILFVPLLETLASMLACADGQAVFSTALPCWEGLHIFHAAVAAACSFALVIFAAATSLLFFRCEHDRKDAGARIDSRAELQLVLQKAVLVFTFTLLEQLWLLVIVETLLAAITFERTTTLRSHLHPRVQRLHTVLRALALWTTLVLLLAQALEPTRFNGAVELWFLGLPLVGAAYTLQPDRRLPELAAQSFPQADQAARQIAYFLSILLRRDKGDHDAEIELRGFIFSHEDGCSNQTCQLKQFKRNVSQRKKVIDNNLLLHHAQNMYRQAIHKFPTDAGLRIQYSYFLMAQLGKKDEALHELSEAEQLKPTWEEEFIIYRNRRYYEELDAANYNKQKNNSELGAANNNSIDLVTIFAFESTFRQLQAQIERCTSFHMEFWGQLKVDRPDLQKLGDCGFLITRSIRTLEQLWAETIKLDANAPKALKLYGRFLKEILHDEEAAAGLLQRAKEVSNTKRNFSALDADVMNVSADGSPCIFVSGDSETLGTITQCNMSAVRVFGYQQHELRGQRVEKLMPELYGVNHRKMLEDAIAKGADNIQNKERFVFARHKSGYVFPVWIQFKLVMSSSSEINFIALFKIDKKAMSAFIGYVLVGKDRKIYGVSSSCQKMMGLDLSLVRRMTVASYDLSRLSPDLEDHREEMLASRSPMVLEWIVPQFAKKRWPRTQEVEKLQKKMTVYKASQKSEAISVQTHKKQFRFQCTLTPIAMGVFGEIGYCIRLDTIQAGHQKRQQCRVGQPLFQFRFDIYSSKFVREMRDPASQDTMANKNPAFFAQDEERLGNQSTTEESMSADSETQRQHKALREQQELMVRRRTWGKGISLYQLRDGKLSLKSLVDEEAQLAQQEAKKLREQQEEARKQTSSMAAFTNTIKSRQALKRVLQSSSVPQAIVNLRFTLNMVIAALISLSIAEFVVVQQQFLQVNENIGLIQRSYSQVSEVQRVAYDIRSILLVNANLLNASSYLPSGYNLSSVMLEDISAALSSLYDLQDFMSMSTLTMDSAHSSLLQTKQVPLYFLQQNGVLQSLNFTLNEAVLQLASAIFTVSHYQPREFTDRDDDVFFVMYNSFNDLLIAMLESSRMYVSELLDRVSQKNTLLLILFVASLVITCLSIPVLIPAIGSVNKTKDQVLSLFFEIPETFVAMLGIRCETFLASLNTQEADKEEEVASNDETSTVNEAVNAELYGSSKQGQKQARRQSSMGQTFLAQYTLAVLLVIGYFTSMFIVAKQYVSDVETASKELDVLAHIEATTGFLLNAQREMLANPSMPVLKNGSFIVTRESMLSLEGQVERFVQMHQEGRSALGWSYREAFKRVMNTDLCSQVDTGLLPVSCPSLFDGVPTHGLQTLLITYFEQLRQTLSTYMNVTGVGKGSNNQTNRQVNGPGFRDLYWMQARFLQSSLRSLVGALTAATEEDFERTLDIKMSVFIVFVIVTVCGHLFFWLPFMARLNQDIQRTRQMLTIVPIDVVLRRPKMLEYLNKDARTNKQ